MKKLAAILGIALSLIVVGAVSAHDATGIKVSIDCNGAATVAVGYEQFSDGHRLVTTIDFNGTEVVKTETPDGAGSVTYALSGVTTDVAVTVTTPDDDNAPLTASAKLPTDCTVITPPPSHHPHSPIPTPPHSATAQTAADAATPGYVEFLALTILLVAAVGGSLAYAASRSGCRRPR